MAKEEHVTFENILLCRDAKENKITREVSFLNAGGTFFEASLPRGLCKLYVRVRIPPLDNSSEYVLSVVVKWDGPQKSVVKLRPSIQTFLNDRDDETQPLILSAVFDLDSRNELKRFDKEGQYTVYVTCGCIDGTQNKIFSAKTNFYLKSPSNVTDYPSGIQTVSVLMNTSITNSSSPQTRFDPPPTKPKKRKTNE